MRFFGFQDRNYLEVLEKVPGTGRIDATDSFTVFGPLSLSKDEFPKIEQLFKQLLKIKSSALPPNDPDLALLLNAFARLYINMGEYANAEEKLLHAKSMLEASRPEAQGNLAYVLNNLGYLYFSEGKYDNADSLFKEGFERLVAWRGPKHADVILFKNNIGMLYYTRGEYTKAELSLQDGVSICQEALAKDNEICANILNSLATVYFAEGLFKRAKEGFLNALAVLETKLGTNRPEVSNVYSNLAMIYYQQGDYVKAEELLQQALKSKEAVLGSDHPDLAVYMNNLAEVYRIKGDFPHAETQLQCAVKLLKDAYGEESVNAAPSVANLGALYFSKGDVAKAGPLLQEAITSLEKALGEWHPYLAVILNNQAMVYEKQGDPGREESALRRAQAILEKTFGQDHINVANILNNLGQFYFNKKDYVQAESLLQRSLRVSEKFLGANSSTLAIPLRNLAMVYEASGDVLKAIQYRKRAEEICEHTLDRNMVGGSEHQKLLYLKTLSDEMDLVVSLHLKSAPKNVAAARLALATVLRRKGRVLDSMTDVVATLRGRDPGDREVFDQLIDDRAKLATLVIKGVGDEDPDLYRGKLRRLEEEIDRDEAELATRSEEFRMSFQPVTLEGVQSRIPPDAALVEFVSFSPFDAKADEWGKRRYAAYVIWKQGDPTWVDLGDAATIDSDILKLKDAVLKASTDVIDQARVVDDEVMRPVRSLLRKTQRIFVSPDRALNLIPFAMLVDERHHYLVEGYTISYLTSGRDLLRLQTSLPSRQGPVIMLNPLFDFDYGNAAAADTAEQHEQIGLSPENRRPLEFDVRFSPLDAYPGEAREWSETVNGATVLEGAYATESALKKVTGPVILHLKTHGFFLDSQKSELKHRMERGLENLSPAAVALGENPLLLSGLALSGANRRNGGNGEDGILTSLEVSGLDLWGTKLVVLSACQTGLGDQQAGEGVYGLRRALVLAGSESQIISLWSIDPLATAALLKSFYHELSKGKDRAEAMRAAQLDLLKNVNFRRPYYWAGLLQSGDWRSLNDTALLH